MRIFISNWELSWFLPVVLMKQSILKTSYTDFILLQHQLSCCHNFKLFIFLSLRIDQPNFTEMLVSLQRD